MKNKIKLSLRLGIGFAFVILISLSISVLGYLTMRVAQEHFRNELRSKISGIALTAAGIINVDAHSRIQTRSDEGGADYLEVKKKFKQILSANPEVRFIYTARMKKNNPHFVVDAEDDPKKVSHVGDIYNEASKSLKTMLQKPTTVFIEKEFVTDKWGTFLSGYATLKTKSGLNDGIVGVDVNAKYVIQSENRIRNIILLCTAVTIALSAIIGLIVAARISKPLEELTLEAKKIQKLHLTDNKYAPSIIKEIDELAMAFAGMKKGLDSFRKYVPTDLVSDLLKSRKEATLGTSRRIITVLFSDIENFTSITENLSSAQLAEMMSLYLETISNVIRGTGGTIDKFIGDSVMAFWNAPHDNENHAFHACEAALKCQKALNTLNVEFKSKNLPEIKTRIGISTGETIVGNIGTNARMNYTAIGDTVNVASRIEKLNKNYNTSILISENTQLQAASSYAARLADRVLVKGKKIPVLIYELIAKNSELKESELMDLKNYNLGITKYLEGDLVAAFEILSSISGSSFLNAHLESALIEVKKRSQSGIISFQDLKRA